MTDIVSRRKRSQMMSGIHGSNTRPERLVRSALHRAGFRFRLTSGSNLPGRPDVVLTRHRIAIFVHGCFWHRHPGCQFAYSPKSNRSFWNQKFRENMARDARVMRELGKAGWRTIVIWECSIRENRLKPFVTRVLAAAAA